MAHEPAFHVLGHLEVTHAGRPVAVPAGRQRTLLAALLLNANQTVQVDDLIRHLWNGALPARPRAAVHTHLTRLRHILDLPGVDPAALIHTSVAGYRIQVAADRLDLLRFRKLTAKAKRHAEQGDLAAESAVLADALALWRGPPLPEVRSESLHRDVLPGLAEEWLHAMDRHHAARITLGQHGELVGELRTLIRRYPFHERFWHNLMVALHRSGRRAEALQTFNEVSEHLRDELDIDPSPELRTLYDAIRHGTGSPGATAE